MKTQDLEIWQLSIDMVTDIYKISAMFPEEEKFGLTSQIRRAAISIPSNIAEGNGRASQKEFSQFLIISRGSLSEVETQLFIAEKLAYQTSENLEEIRKKISRLFKMIHSFLHSLKK